MRRGLALLSVCVASLACTTSAEESESDGAKVRRGARGGRGGSEAGGPAGGSSPVAGGGGKGGKGGATAAGGSSAGSGSGTFAGAGGSGSAAGKGAAAGNGAAAGGGAAAGNGAAGQKPVGGAGTGGGTIPPPSCAACPLGATCVAGACVCPEGMVGEADACRKTCAGGGDCPPFSSCDGGVCRCAAGATSVGAGCWPEAPGDNPTHAEADVCAVAAWGRSSVQTEIPQWTPGPAQCDGGSLPGWVRHDVANRLAMYRWFAGLGPALPSIELEPQEMACAAAASWNVQYGHSIPMGAMCYSPAGAQGASSSNIAWGTLGAGSVDAWVDDRNDQTNTFGHRFSLLAEGLGSFGFGHYAGGGSYGVASCMAAGFGGGSGKPTPFPPAGIVPAFLASMPWTVGGVQKTNDAQATVVEKASGKAHEIVLGGTGSFGASKIYLQRVGGWEPEAGITYTVSVTGLSVPVDYEMTVVACP